MVMRSTSPLRPRPAQLRKAVASDGESDASGYLHRYGQQEHREPKPPVCAVSYLGR